MASDNKQPIQSWEVLLRAFELERSKGCVDSAVLGGVDRLITNYATALELIDPEFDPKKFQYRALQPGSRETLLVKWIAEITPRINFYRIEFIFLQRNHFLQSTKHCHP